jgi:HEAT repeat protein
MKSNKKQEIQRNIELLNDEDFEVRLRAIRNLAIIGDASIVEMFLEILDDQTLMHQPFKYTVYTEVIFNLQFLLEKFPDQNVEDKIIQILVDESEENTSYRALYAEVLGRLKSARALPVLIELLNNTPPEIQESIVYALRLIGNKAALPALHKLVGNHEAQTANAKVIRTAQDAIQAISKG